MCKIWKILSIKTIIIIIIVVLEIGNIQLYLISVAKHLCATRSLFWEKLSWVSGANNNVATTMYK
jgi:hypothetical protein